MKNKLITMAAAVATLVGFSASATPITGSIGFGGTYTQNGGIQGDLSTATSMSINTVNIQNVTGSFVGATSPSFATPILVNPGTGLTQLWQVLVGALTYTFNVTSESQTFTSGTQLNLAGNGVISDNLGDSANGVWQLGFGVSGDSFTWQSTSAANVPDGGTTVALLGGALAGLGLLKRKFLA
jgi:VPDSG-CTERM motif